MPISARRGRLLFSDVIQIPLLHMLQDEAMTYQVQYKQSPPREVIVFIIGGSTYEESK